MWRGWIFNAGIWESMCSADDLGLCSHLLERICAERMVNGNTHSAVTRGDGPRWTPRGESRPLPADAAADVWGDEL